MLLVKLAERLHNMRTVKFMAEERRRIKAKETLTQIIPIAKKIGQPKLINELYDLSLKYLHERIITSQDTIFKSNDRQRIGCYN